MQTKRMKIRMKLIRISKIVRVANPISSIESVFLTTKIMKTTMIVNLISRLTIRSRMMLNQARMHLRSSLLLIRKSQLSHQSSTICSRLRKKK